MFKLIKINNSRNNCPEFMKIDAVDAEIELCDGTIVDRSIDTVVSPSGTPKFMIVGDYNKDTTNKITVYPITGDMIFRTFVVGDARNVIAGSTVSYATSDIYNVTDCVTLDEDGMGRVVNIIGKIDGKLYVDVCFDGR